MTLLHPPGRRAALVLATSFAVAATSLLSPPLALAGGGSHGHGGGGGGHGGGGAPWTVVASGLDNPRQLSVDGGSPWYGRRHGGGHGHPPTLYVAEAGRGGAGPCVEGPEGDSCFGLSGAVTRIDRRGQSRVVTGLPSLAGEGGGGAIGPADVLVRGSWYAVTVGLGLPPAERDTFPEGARLGTLVAGRLGGGQVTVADLAQYEADNDPDEGGPDSNPTGMSLSHRGVVLTDSGANALQAVDWRGDITTLAIFPERVVPSPFPPPAPPTIDMDAVPTSVVRGPDGAWYVSQLTGFPFPPGGANIYRVVPGHAPTVYAAGLTNVTDLAWSGRSLYAVQIAGEGGLAAPPPPGTPPGTPPMGSLVRIDRDGTHTTVASGLPAPYGVAIDGDQAYVTTCSVCPGQGGVVSVRLR